MYTTPGTTESDLSAREAKLDNQRTSSRAVYYFAWFLALATGVFTVFYAIPGKQEIEKWLTIIGILTIAFLMWSRWRLRAVDAAYEDVRFDMDLLSVGDVQADLHRRAEKLLRVSHAQLRRYYEINVAQNLWVFGLGALCIFFGVLILLGTVYLILDTGHDAGWNGGQKVIIAVTGLVGSTLCNFIAALFIRMHTSANQSFNAFHGRLVASHQLLLGNLVAAGIKDDTHRYRTLAHLALRVATPSDTRNDGRQVENMAGRSRSARRSSNRDSVSPAK